MTDILIEVATTAARRPADVRAGIGRLASWTVTVFVGMLLLFSLQFIGG